MVCVMELIGYAETPIRIEPVQWAPADDECMSCGVKLTPGATGNIASCDFHDQCCDRCDADLIHPHGRAV